MEENASKMLGARKVSQTNTAISTKESVFIDSQGMKYFVNTNDQRGHKTSTLKKPQIRSKSVFRSC